VIPQLAAANVLPAVSCAERFHLNCWVMNVEVLAHLFDDVPLPLITRIAREAELTRCEGSHGDLV
jgi:hypothetical protein